MRNLNKTNYEVWRKETKKEYVTAWVGDQIGGIITLSINMCGDLFVTFSNHDVYEYVYRGREFDKAAKEYNRLFDGGWRDIVKLHES